MSDRLIVIDFCETIADYQTFDPFIEFILSHEKRVVYKLLCGKVSKIIINTLDKIFHKLGSCKYLYKIFLIHAAKNIEEWKFDMYGREYYNTKVKKALIKETIDIIRSLQEEGCRTVILSGGSKYYINCFAEEYGIDDVVSTEVGMENGRCSGSIVYECFGKEKVRRLAQYIDDSGIGTIEKICITDSSSDLPLLSICDRKIIISHWKHKEWVTSGMEEIIWE